MNEYIGYSFADDEDDDKKLDASDRAVGVKKRWKASAKMPKQRRFPVQKEYAYPQRRYYDDEYGPPQRSYQGYEFQGYGPPTNYQSLRMMPYKRQRGPCYQCGQPGHIRANCPNCRPPPKEYPFNHNGVDSMEECLASLCVKGVVKTSSVGVATPKVMMALALMNLLKPTMY